MSFRKEKKYKLSRVEFNTVKNSLLHRGMRQIHSGRSVNSLYFDTETYEMFHDSEEGLLPRKKVRIRWYGDISKANSEVKTSSVEGRFKTTKKANVQSFATIPRTLFDSDYGVISPSILVSYFRQYFVFESIRFTFDSNIKYVDYRRSSCVEYKEKERVMELKVDAEMSDDYMETILPFPTSRFSKYCRALLISRP
jgi:hypothetical protein